MFWSCSCSNAGVPRDEVAGTRFSPARPGNMVSSMSTDPILKFVPKIFSARGQ